MDSTQFVHGAKPIWSRQGKKLAVWDDCKLRYAVAVKAKPECCSEQNRNGKRGPVKLASAIDIGS